MRKGHFAKIDKITQIQSQGIPLSNRYMCSKYGNGIEKGSLVAEHVGKNKNKNKNNFISE